MVRLADAHSLLHLSVGIIFRFWNIKLPLGIAIHLLFEYIEHTQPMGGETTIVHRMMKWWPTDKENAESIFESLIDTIWFAIGWLVANAAINRMPAALQK